MSTATATVGAQPNLRRMDSVLFFVYGTLRKGFGNHFILGKSAEFIMDYRTAPAYTMISFGGFPGVIPGGNTAITGEVYRVSGDDIGRVCDLEGFTGIPGHPDNWYDVEKLELPVGDAYMFVMKKGRPHAPVVESGDWAAR